MHDIKEIRKNPELFTKRLSVRVGEEKAKAMVKEILDLDTARRKQEISLQQIRTEQNQIGSQIAQAKRAGEDSSELERYASVLKELYRLAEQGVDIERFIASMKKE